MDYYKNIDFLDWQPFVDRYEHLISNAGQIHSGLLPPEEREWLQKQLGNHIDLITGRILKIKNAIMFYQVGDHQRTIHCDGADLKDHKEVTWALNIPIKNCENSKMIWYSGEYELHPAQNPKGLAYLRIDWKTEPVEVASCVVDRPTLVRITIPHNVINYSSSPRCVLSLRFSPDLFDQ